MAGRSVPMKCLATNFTEPALILGQQFQLPTARADQEMRLTIVIVLHLLTRRVIEIADLTTQITERSG
ncbi:MAG: hypothetical protein JWP89_6333 [Schlesneria sp.]|nr:hypothetical protein [Schlesneria sp.]